jgi:hypothetical protein
VRLLSKKVGLPSTADNFVDSQVSR